VSRALLLLARRFGGYAQKKRNRKLGSRKAAARSPPPVLNKLEQRAPRAPRLPSPFFRPRLLCCLRQYSCPNPRFSAPSPPKSPPPPAPAAYPQRNHAATRLRPRGPPPPASLCSGFLLSERRKKRRRRTALLPRPPLLLPIIAPLAPRQQQLPGLAPTSLFPHKNTSPDARAAGQGLSSSRRRRGADKNHPLHLFFQPFPPPVRPCKNLADTSSTTSSAADEVRPNPCFVPPPLCPPPRASPRTLFFSVSPPPPPPFSLSLLRGRTQTTVSSPPGARPYPPPPAFRGGRSSGRFTAPGPFPRYPLPRAPRIVLWLFFACAVETVGASENTNQKNGRGGDSQCACAPRAGDRPPRPPPPATVTGTSVRASRCACQRRRRAGMRRLYRVNFAIASSYDLVFSRPQK